MGHAEHMEVRAFGKRTTMIDAVGNQRIVVARQDDDRHGCRGNYVSGPIQEVVRKPVAIEGVAGKKHNVRIQTLSGAQHRGKPRGPIPAMQPGRIAMIHVQIRAMNDYNVLIGRE